MARAIAGSLLPLNLRQIQTMQCEVRGGFLTTSAFSQAMGQQRTHPSGNAGRKARAGAALALIVMLHGLGGVQAGPATTAVVQLISCIAMY